MRSLKHSMSCRTVTKSGQRKTRRSAARKRKPPPPLRVVSARTRARRLSVDARDLDDRVPGERDSQALNHLTEYILPGAPATADARVYDVPPPVVVAAGNTAELDNTDKPRKRRSSSKKKQRSKHNDDGDETGSSSSSSKSSDAPVNRVADDTTYDSVPHRPVDVPTYDTVPQ
jgi:hypothetical protein